MFCYIKYGNPSFKFSLIKYWLDNSDLIYVYQYIALNYYCFKLKRLLCEDPYILIEHCEELLSVALKNNDYYVAALWAAALWLLSLDLNDVTSSRKYRKKFSKYFKKGKSQKAAYIPWEVLADALANIFESAAENKLIIIEHLLMLFRRVNLTPYYFYSII
ncbi:MAG: hypothetical protein K6B18_09205 [Ruminococcus sp.]|nr:hypothetical protein [Ruminococcus sp.]